MLDYLLSSEQVVVVGQVPELETSLRAVQHPSQISAQVDSIQIEEEAQTVLQEQHLRLVVVVEVSVHREEEDFISIKISGLI